VNYCTELRALVIAEINGWLDGCYKDILLYAISTEEIEAWCLAAIEKRDTAQIANPKQVLNNYLNRNNLSYKKFRLDPTKHKKQYFEEITKELKFHKIKKLKEHSEFNLSLKAFVQSIEDKFL